MSDLNTPPPVSKPAIILSQGWATHIHKSNDPLNPWFAVTDQKTDKNYAQGWSSTKEYIDTLLPPWMLKDDKK